MIVKGKPRSGPEQLAAYLMRTGDGEHPTLLQLQYGDGDLRKAFLDWHTVGEGTRGEHTLYHAQIAPDPRYKLTPEQCLRAAEILAEDMGMKNHPRAVVLHDGGDKPHIHVVFMRTNIDTMTMWDDGKNYLKHERASHRMELEFGHELVPGKHKVKRNREKQPEFPRAKSDQADYQQANRTGISFDERKAELAGIRKSCDDAPAFKNALEEAGYILAKGEKRGFVVVDGDGEVFSLSKHLAGDIKGKEYKTFMAPLDQAALPTVEEAKALHKQREEEAAVKAEKPAPEASKFLTPAAPEKAPEPTPAPPVSKFLPKADAPAPVSPPPAPEVKPFDYELYAAYNRPAPVVEPPAAPVVAPQQAPASKFLPEKETVQPTPAAEPPKPAPTAEKPAGIDLTLYAPMAPAPTPPPPAPAPTTKQIQRREPLPSDPWMAQIGGVDKLSSDHLASAKRSYDAWPLKNRYDFENYISYVQRQWKDVELPPPPQAAAPQPTKTAYDVAPAPEPANWFDRELTSKFKGLQPPEPAPEPKQWEEREIFDLRKSIWKSQQKEYQEHAEQNGRDYKDHGALLDEQNRMRMEDFDIAQRAARIDMREQMLPAPKKGFQAMIDKVLNPQHDEAITAARQEEFDLFRSRQAEERREYIKTLEQNKRVELETFRERQLAQQADRERNYNEEIERRVREYVEAKRLAKELEADQREKDLKREGPEPPELGKE